MFRSAFTPTSDWVKKPDAGLAIRRPYLESLFPTALFVMSALISGLVSLLVIVFLEVPPPRMVFIVREIILAVAHTLLVVLVLRVILFVLFLWRRHHARRSSGNTKTQGHHADPDTLLQIHSHKSPIRRHTEFPIRFTVALRCK